MEENGRRVHFSNEVQYFEDEEFPTELEDCFEEMDEELDEGSPPEGQKILWTAWTEEEKSIRWMERWKNQR